MADPREHLDRFDRLMADLGRALSAQDWDRLAELNRQVQPAAEPLMVALEAQELSAGEVRTRLEEMQQLVEAMDQGAVRARQEAQDALKGVNQNRNAAKMYQNVSSNRPK
ncbi:MULTISPECIES: SOS cell division inhibitor [Marinobacter]|uniref:SOS cell division inhibitor n=1 Tax=Marinobacter TaxID=2742 RepID=UPI001108F058|nr:MULTISPECIES: SOS cell division inhibitor [Marinobacter]MCK2150002.1 SOS cell division inhibitor [Marinobacter alexandrii]